MSYIKGVADAAGNAVNIYYEDWGQGKPVVLIHGWPLDHSMWEHQAIALANAGYRVIAYDRRGFGRSSRPWGGYDYDTMTGDLHNLMEELDLKDATLVGFSMGGGEVARYLGKYGDSRVSKAIFVSAVTPYLKQTDDNPDGVDPENLKPIMEGLKKDRFDFLQGFAKKFYGVGVVSHPVSDAVLQWNQTVVSLAAPNATIDTANAFADTDFRADMQSIKVPTRFIHGDADETVPLDNSAKRAVKLVPGSELFVYEGEPHGLFFTAKDRLSKDLIAFISGTEPTTTIQ